MICENCEKKESTIALKAHCREHGWFEIHLCDECYKKFCKICNEAKEEVEDENN